MKNVNKGWFTTIAGIAIFIVVIVMIFTGKTQWIWNGIAGISIGVVLILSPETLEKNIMEVLNKLKGNGNS